MTAASSVALPSPGGVVGGKYLLERELGRGGMGAVFAARHTRMGNAVAIKVMLADAANQEAFTRFMNEARAASNIQSEHVVRVTDVDEENGYAFMVLELLDGEDLAQVLDKEKRLPPHVAVSYAMQAMSGVAQAHAHGIVHRDLKPSNLFLTKRNDGSRVIKVLDFGISKQGASALAQKPANLTSTKAMLGSPLYMSPEQLRSSKTVDHRADIWAMGVILYELMTGSLPFTGESLGELFAAILETEAVPVHQRISDGSIAPGLSMLVSRCLSRRPEDRFQSANELISALSQFATSPSGSFQHGHATAAMTAGMSFHAVPPGAAVTPGTMGMGNRPMGMGNTPMPHGMSNTPMPHGMSNTPMPHGMGGPMPNVAYGTGAMRGPPGAANTGSGVVKAATTPLGAQTPQPHDQSMRLSANTIPKSRVGIFLGAAAFFGIVGIALIVVFMMKKPAAEPITTTGSAGTSTSSDPVPPPSAVALPSATAATSATATATATATTPPSATTAAVVATVATPTSNPVPTGKRIPPPPVKTDPPPPTAKTTGAAPTSKPPTDIGATR